jgi:hypothetical protein
MRLNVMPGRKLRDQADAPEIQRSGPEHKSWKAKVVAVMQRGLGQNSGTLHEFQQLRYTVGVWPVPLAKLNGMPSTSPNG